MNLHHDSDYASNYDQFWSFPESLYQPTLKLALKELEVEQPARILDMGCGPGHHTVFLDGLFVGETIGLDTSIEMLNRARERTSEVGLLQASGESLPVANNVFALVFMSYVIHQVAEKEKLFSEAYRVLKSDGYIAILTSSHEQLRNDLLHQWFPGILERNLERFPTLPEIRDLLVGAGFDNMRSSIISTKREISAAQMMGLVREKCISVLKLLSEEEFQNGLSAFEETLRSKCKDKLIYEDSTSLVIADRLV